MKVSFTNSFSHTIKFSIYNLSRSRYQQISTLIFMGIIAFLYWTKVQTIEGTVLSKFVIFLIIEFFFVVVILAFNLLAVFFSNSPKKNKGVFTNHEVVLSEDGLYEETSFNKSEYSWSGIEKVIQTRSFIFIYVSEHAAHVIPKDAFESEGEADQFFDYAYQHWKMSRE